MDKLFSTKIYDNYLKNEETDDTSDDGSREFNNSNDDSNSDIDEVLDSYPGKRLAKQNGEIRNRTQYSNNNMHGNNSTKLKTLRQPTRRPDPRVCNRNALMARENRRRKKELINQMENQISDVSKENKYLRKLVKQQGQTISKLNNEKLYYKSIILNRTEILKLLQTIGATNLPVTSSEIICDKDKSANNNSTSLRCAASLDYDDECENGIVTDPLLSQLDTSFIDENYFLFPDLGCNTPSSTISEDYIDSSPACGFNGWDNLLNYNELAMPLFSDETDLLDNRVSLNIKSEHNYTYTENESIQPGVCLHVSSGRVSLEFCASCHNRAQNAYLKV